MSDNTMRAIFARKPCDLSDLNLDGEAAEIEIEDRREMTAAEYDEFSGRLLASRDWLDRKGGYTSEGKRLVTEVTAPDRKTLYVDPQGHDYARYVGIAAREGGAA